MHEVGWSAVFAGSVTDVRFPSMYDENKTPEKKKNKKVKPVMYLARAHAFDSRVSAR